jgi:prepilin-type N-terminal cleavage/methylation domain-containing protein
MTIIYQQNGLTLIENLIAIAIFSLGMLGITNLTVTIAYGRTLSQTMTTATILAQNKLEDVQSAEYASIINEHETIVGENHMSYTRILEVTADEPAPGMKTVDIAVLWSTRKAREHRVILTTIVSDSH